MTLEIRASTMHLHIESIVPSTLPQILPLTTAILLLYINRKPLSNQPIHYHNIMDYIGSPLIHIFSESGGDC